MKRWLPGLALLICVRGGIAQEKVPDEDARKAAKLVLEASAKVKSPVKVELDAEKPYAVHHNDHGALVIPVKSLTAETIEKAGEQFVPVGQLWFRDLTLVTDKKPIPKASFQTVTVTHDDKEITLVRCYLGVRKVKNSLSLVILSKDMKPLKVVTLKKEESKQEMPIEFQAKAGDGEAVVTLNLLGKYTGSLTVVPAKE
jgi:hypothetical protein